MAKTSSMTSNENHDDDVSLSFSNTFGNGDVPTWSDLNHDGLLLVMMQLGVTDFIASGRVCKSWRSVALSNKKTFMASKPAVSICISTEASEDDWRYLEDFEGRSSRTIFTHSAGWQCIGSTCGYLILYRRTSDYWLVNPITSHELRFPRFLSSYYDIVTIDKMKAIRFVVTSRYGSVFVMQYADELYYDVGKGKCRRVDTILPICDLHIFKGRIYTLHTDCSLRELRFNLRRKLPHEWVTPEIKNCPYSFKPELVSTAENLYLIYGDYKVMELEFGEMKWVSTEKTTVDFAVFLKNFKSCVDVKPELRAGPQSQDLDNYKLMWNFPYDCSHSNLSD